MSITSKLEKTASYLRSARHAIAGRGGEISATAGLKDLPNAIFNIPIDSSLGYYIDDTTAYEKTVPNEAQKYCMLNSIGGMTYKSNNLFNPAWLDETKELVEGITVTNNGDGSITINGTGEVPSYNMGYYLYDGTRFNANSMYLSIDKPLPENLAICAYSYSTNEEGNWEGEVSHWIYGDITSVSLSGWVNYIFITRVWDAASSTVTAENFTIKPVLSSGSVKPYEPYYEGLRDSKVTALKVYGANKLKLASKTVTSKGITAVVDGENGTITLNGTATADASLVIIQPASPFTLEQGKSYTMSGVPEGVGATKWWLSIQDTTYKQTIDISTTTPRTFTANYSNYYLYITVKSGYTADNIVITPTLHEGDTVKEPTTYALPESVQALSGYGEGNPYNTSEYNTVDFENQTFIKKGAISSGEWESFTTPEVTDISAELAGFDPFIYVEPTGEIEFVNEYENAVPSTITYIVKAGS